MQAFTDSIPGDQDPANDRSLKLHWKIQDERIAQWMHRADLARISGKCGMYLPALAHAGIETVPELAQSDPSNLMAAIRNFNPGKRNAHLVPNESQVAKWIGQATLMLMAES